MEETKTVDAVVENKEDEMGLTTQNQDEITIEEGTPEPKNAALWKKAKRVAAKAGHKDDIEYIESVYAELMVEKENPKEPNVNDLPTVNWKRAIKRAAKEGHEGDFNYIAAICEELDAMDEDKSPKNPTKDEEINAVGADVPTVERERAEPKSKAKVKDVQGLVHRECVDRAAIIFLAKTLLTSTDLEDFKTLYPSLF